MKLNNKIASGIGWASLSTFGTQGIRLIFKLILAKLLLPEHYGIIGMATVFTSFVNMVSELGLNAALIQKKKNNLYPAYFDTAFWSNLTISVFGYGIIYLAVAPFAAWFYKEDILTDLIPVIGLSVVLNSFYVMPKVMLSREMDFKPQAVIEIAASLSSGVAAIVLAYMGYGVWALAFNGILTSIISIFLYYLKVRWIPKFRFDMAAFKDLFGFGSKVLIESVFSFFTLNIDYILIGKLIGGAALGAYTLAFILTNTFMKQVVNILNNVLYPAYSTLQDDIRKIAYYYLRLAKINNLFMAPIMTVFFVLADSVIAVGFGQEWSNTVFPLRALSLAVIVSSIGGSSSIVMRSVGRPDLSMKLNMFCTTFSTVPAVVIGATTYGINGAALGILADRLVRFGFYQHQIKKLTGITVMNLFGQVAGTLAMCTLIGLLIHYIDHAFAMSPLVTLLMGISLTMILYGLYVYLFERKILYKVIKIARIKERILVPLFNLL